MLSVDSCIEVVKGLYGWVSPRRHGGTGHEKWGTPKNANGLGGMCVASQGDVIGITKGMVVIRFKRVRESGIMSRVRFATLIVDS